MKNKMAGITFIRAMPRYSVWVSVARMNTPAPMIGGMT
jgi:hypothetical protein